MTDNLGTHAGMIFQHNIRRLSLSFQLSEKETQRKKDRRGYITWSEYTYRAQPLLDVVYAKLIHAF